MWVDLEILLNLFKFKIKEWEFWEIGKFNYFWIIKNLKNDILCTNFKFLNFVINNDIDKL